MMVTPNLAAHARVPDAADSTVDAGGRVDHPKLKRFCDT